MEEKTRKKKNEKNEPKDAKINVNITTENNSDGCLC